jgi:hypothetical protein
MILEGDLQTPKLASFLEGIMREHTLQIEKDYPPGQEQ